MSGEYANPLVGNFYGTKANGWGIDFAKSDCGYGISQVTDGMRVGQRPIAEQTAIALDYAANIAAGVQILESKWNQLFAHGMLVNGGDPRWIENWYLALWAYNSGYHELGDPKTDGTVEGLGWLNNPANPHYPQNRAPFLEYGYSDAAHPQDWPYQEKVIGWAGHPIATLDGAGYRAAWWVSVEDRIHAQPPPSIACTDSNECQYGSEFPPNDPGVIGEPAGPCAHKSPAGKYNLQCFWHSPMGWKGDCSDSCGHELERFDPGQYPEQPDGTHYPPQCSRGDLPGNAIVVDDLAASTPSASCSSRASNSGTFGLRFGTDVNGHHPAKIDLHQLGGGWGGHFWFAHTWNGNDPEMRVTGTWTPASRLSGWTRVLVHIPDHGALTQRAHYRIHLGNGQTEDRYIPTDIEANSWVSLGVFDFVAGADTPRLVLDNAADDGDGTSDVAWDAAAFAHLPGNPRDIVVQLGDSYSSGQGAGHYDPVSNRGLPLPGNGNQNGSPTWNACRRSTVSWARKAVLPGATSSTGQRADSYDVSLDYHSVACSGAVTKNLDPNLGSQGWGHPGQHHEVAQLDSGFLDTNTTIVELTIGGNDIGFSRILQGCSFDPSTGCPSYEEWLPHIDALAGPLTTLLKDIHIAAPHAKIVLLGYPELFPTNPTTPCASAVLGRYQQRLNDWADYLSVVQDNVVKQLEKSIPVEYYYPGSITEFGAHELCDPAPAFNDLVLGPRNGPSDYDCPVEPICASMESFHPNELGTTIYARALQNALKP
jgi:hypothetical protein